MHILTLNLSQAAVMQHVLAHPGCLIASQLEELVSSGCTGAALCFCTQAFKEVKRLLAKSSGKK